MGERTEAIFKRNFPLDSLETKEYFLIDCYKCVAQ